MYALIEIANDTATLINTYSTKMGCLVRQELAERAASETGQALIFACELAKAWS